MLRCCRSTARISSLRKVLPRLAQCSVLPSKQSDSVPLQCRTASSTSRSRGGTTYSSLSIYNAGTLRTATVGFSRFGSAVFFLYSLVFNLPALIIAPTVSSWWAPALVAGSALPYAITALTTAPIVLSMRIYLPNTQTWSKASILDFTKRLPQDTKVVMQTMRFGIWPGQRTYRFSQLKRLPGNSWQQINLEAVSTGPASLPSETGSTWLPSRFFNKYYIDRSHPAGSNSAPGVLEALWEQIPVNTKRSATTT